MLFNPQIAPARFPLFLLCFFLLSASGHAQGLVRGTIIEAGTGRPVPGALIELANGVRRIASATTDSTGAFTLQASINGDAVLAISRIGYTALRRGIRLNARDETLLPITMQPLPLPLDAINVEGERGVLEDRLQGYMRRRDLGAGYFLSEQKLKNTAGTPLSDVLRSVPGIEVSNRRTVYGPLIFTNTNQIQNQLSPFRRGAVPNSQMPIGPCPMQLYIDGRHFSTQDMGIDILKPEDLVAVEVFRSVAEVPAEFGGLHVRCGVISVWTRRVPGR